MKRNFTVVGLLLLLLLAGSSCHRAWHGRKDMNDSGKMIRMRMAQLWMGHRSHFMGRYPMGGMRGNMGQGMRNGMMRGMGPGSDMMRGMSQMPTDSIGWMPMGPGRRILESIPNVTENQKKLIQDLAKKQQDEMKQLREEMTSKMQSLMDSHRKDILNILTDDQKKFIESGQRK
jgi:hypothetical protein